VARPPYLAVLVAVTACPAIAQDLPVEELVQEGGRLLDSGDAEGALAKYEQAIASDPKLAPAYLGRGQARERLGSEADAIADFWRAVELAPKDARCQNAVSWILLTAKDESLRDCLTALTHARKAAALSRHRSPAILDTLALALHETGQPEGAVKTQERAIELLADSVGDAERKEFTDRLETFRAANDTPARRAFQAGRAKLMERDLDGALAEFNKALELDPTLADAYYGRANVRGNKRDLQGAIADYEATIKHRPSHARAHSDLALVLVNVAVVRDLPRALKLAKQACALTLDSNAMFLATLAVAQFRSGALEDAVATQKKALAAIRPQAADRMRTNFEKRLAEYEAAVTK
jgi:tetratricopeptide (TPR) repeat protein